MGWYKVIKTINGHRYIYWQRTHRVNGRVKTENKYVGPARARSAPISPLPPSVYSPTAPRTPEAARTFFPQKRVFVKNDIFQKLKAVERNEDARIQYGSLKLRKLRQAKQLRAAKKLTRHLRPVNYFIAKMLLHKK